jgi:hypothetical protein
MMMRRMALYTLLFGTRSTGTSAAGTSASRRCGGSHCRRPVPGNDGPAPGGDRGLPGRMLLTVQNVTARARMERPGDDVEPTLGNRFLVLTVELRDEGGRRGEEARHFRTPNPYFFQLLDANRVVYDDWDATFFLEDTPPCEGPAMPAQGPVRCRLVIDVPPTVTSGTLEYDDYRGPLAATAWQLP